jgi:hypothetical protein
MTSVSVAVTAVTPGPVVRIVIWLEAATADANVLSDSAPEF